MHIYTSMHVYMPVCIVDVWALIQVMFTHTYDLVCSLDLRPSVLCRLGVTKHCLTLGGGWRCIECEAMMGGGIGKGLRTRGYFY